MNKMKFSILIVKLQLLNILLFSKKCTLGFPVEEVSKWTPFEQELLELVEERLSFHEKRLNRLYLLHNILLKYIQQDNDRVESDFLAHPISAFIIINRLVNALDEDEDVSNQFDYKQLKSKLKLPSMDDLIDYGEALLRLQAFYNLSTESIISGKLQVGGANTSASGLQMNGYDCFELGKVAYGNEDWSTSIEWLKKAAELVESEPTRQDTVEILEYLAFAAYKNGQVKEAAELTKLWLSKDPNNERALNNLEHYVEDLKEEEEQPSGSFRPISYADMYMPGGKFLTSDYVLTDDEVVRDLCRSASKSTDHQLTCSRKTLPALVVSMPTVNIEILNLDPKIIRVYDIITEEEAKLIRSLALAKLERSTIQSKQGLVTSDFRVAETAWLSRRSHSIIDRLEERISKLLNFDLTGAEDLQVVNYGVGGYYGPHLDSAREASNETDSEVSIGALKRNDRLATILIYLNSIEAGGSTVFPRLNLTVEPIKFSAVVWFNHVADGSSDSRTLHTGCPILLGTKWIATIWPREEANIFSKPCNRLSHYYY